MFGNSDLIGMPVIASFNADGRIRPLYFQYEGSTASRNFYSIIYFVRIFRNLRGVEIVFF